MVEPLVRWTRWKYEESLSNDENTNKFMKNFNSTFEAKKCNLILTLLEGKTCTLTL